MGGNRLNEAMLKGLQVFKITTGYEIETLFERVERDGLIYE